MEFKEVLMRRRSIRSYTDQEVPLEILTEILQDGMQAPSGTNLQPWYFVALRSVEYRAKLLEVMDRVANAVEPTLRERFAAHPAVITQTSTFLRTMGNAPVVLLAFWLKPEYTSCQDTVVTQSVAAAIENILLSAVDHGLGGCWLTAPVEAQLGDELRGAFAPGKGRLVAMVTLGYPKNDTGASPARKEGRYTIL